MSKNDPLYMKTPPGTVHEVRIPPVALTPTRYVCGISIIDRDEEAEGPVTCKRCLRFSNREDGDESS